MSFSSSLSSVSCNVSSAILLPAPTWHSRTARVQSMAIVCREVADGGLSSKAEGAEHIGNSNREMTGKRRDLILNSSISSEMEGGAQGNGEMRSKRREFILNSSSVAVLAALLTFNGTRPDYIGVQKNPPSLALCPPTPTCISTSEELNDPGHYVPPWTYNPPDGRGRKNPASKEKAMAELIEVVEKTKPDNFTPRIVQRTEDYIYVEYESPIPLFKFVDDVEFWFPPGDRSIVEYRSASRVGSGDFDANRKRIRAIRRELEKKGWASIGY